SIGNDADTVRYFSNNPISPNRRSLVGRVALTSRTVHIPSVMEDLELIFPKDRPTVTPTTMLGVPLLRNDRPIGVIGMSRIAANPLTEKQMALVETFAEQAVIAVENTRLFEAEQTRTRELTDRTRELTETLEYQTATSEILGVMGRSPNDTQPVFNAIARTA